MNERGACGGAAGEAPTASPAEGGEGPLDTDELAEQSEAFQMTDFDAKARTWDGDQAKVERAQRVAQEIAQRIPLQPWMTVLEYGCGTGLLGFALRPRVRYVTFADASGEMIAVVREKIGAMAVENATARHVDLSTGPLPAERYDLVCALMTLHHVPDTEDLLRRFRELLAPGGFVCIADLDQEDGSFHGAGFEGHNGFDRGDFAAQLERAGFGEVSFTTAYEIQKRTSAGPRRFPVFLATAVRR